MNHKFTLHFGLQSFCCFSLVGVALTSCKFVDEKFLYACCAHNLFLPAFIDIAKSLIK